MVNHLISEGYTTADKCTKGSENYNTETSSSTYDALLLGGEIRVVRHLQNKMYKQRKASDRRQGI